MAEERAPAGAAGKTTDRPADVLPAPRNGGAHAVGPGAIYWRYLIFWLLLFSALYFISLYGIVAEA